MDEPKSKLDAYLENLGISDDAEDASPVLPVGRAPAETQAEPLAPLDDAGLERPRRLIASPDAIVEDFLAGMLVYLDPGYTVQARQRNDHVAAEVLGGDSGRIIGREGRTLQAVEFLANTVLAKEAPNSGLRVSVDAAGYRRRHEERLMETAQRAAARVRKHEQESELEPMNAADRRIIHIALRDDPFVTTESVGEGHERRVVVKPR